MSAISTFIDGRSRRDYTLIGIAVVLAVLPLLLAGNLTHRWRLFTSLLIFSILAIALNIVFGHTDQLYLFLGALTGIGAYTTALSANAVGLSPWLTLPLGSLAAGLICLIVSYIAAKRRMTVILISILTLSIQLAFMEFFVGARSITGGSTGFNFSGLRIVFIENALGVSSAVVLYYLLLAVFVVILGIYTYLMRSKFGMAFNAIRQDEVAAKSRGVNVVKHKTLAGLVSGLMIGFVGPFYAQSEQYIVPGMFTFEVIDLLVLIMLILGGIRTMLGPVIGAGVLLYLNEVLLHSVLDGFSVWRTATLGLLLMFLFLYFRQGVVPFYEQTVRSKAATLIENRVKPALNRSRE